MEVYEYLAASTPLAPFTGREVFPGRGTRAELETLFRGTATTHWYSSGTCAIGRDERSVMNARLAVHEVEGMRTPR